MAAEYLLPLADGEKTALTALLKRTIDADRYPLSPRISTLRGILAKLEPYPSCECSMILIQPWRYGHDDLG